jgi:apolipoprotein D and lipocalin family protein
MRIQPAVAVEDSDMRTIRLPLIVLLTAYMTACATDHPLRAIDRKVDLPRFMGGWYVIASIPIFLERGAHNGIESYRLNSDGSIDTSYVFRKGSFDGPIKRYNPTGFVFNRDTNAEWRMQFIWPLRAAYLIIYVDENYQHTIIGVPDRSYVWIMSRTPEIPDAQYGEMLRFLGSVGYDVTKLERVPQRWPDRELPPAAAP